MSAVFVGDNLVRQVGVAMGGMNASTGATAGGRVIVDGASLAIQPGQLVLLCGPSGSGKTTLLHLVSGFDRPTTGVRRWIDQADGQAPAWDTVGVVPQSLGLLAELSFAEQLHLVIRDLPRQTRTQRVAAMLAQLDIADLAGRLPEETSLGQQQRLAVARALIGRPRLIAADEPTSRQDHGHGELIAAALRAACDDGAACLVASHDQRFTRVAHRVLTMLDGVLTEP